MNRSFLSLCFLIAVALPSRSVAQNNTEGYDQYEATRNLSIELYIAAFTNFSNRLRVAASLQACNKTGIANSVSLKPNEAANFIVAEIERLNYSDSKTATILSKLTVREKISLTSSVSDQLIAYELGYKDAIGVFKDRLPAICEASMQEADNMLKERK
jgi:hypothetical protein